MKKTTITIVLLSAILSIVCISCKKDDEIKLIAVKSGDLWGYVDIKGKYVINPQFEKASPFSDGLAGVLSDGKLGYISTDGKYVVKPQYQAGTHFHEGYAFVVTENSYPICINTKGKEVFTLKNVESVTSFHGGLAAYQTAKGEWGYVDTKGKVVISAQFDEVLSFDGGLAPIKIGEKWGYVDKKGNIVINCQFESAKCFSDDGLARIYDGKKWGYINDKGEFVINPQFEYAEAFHDGLAMFSNGKLAGYIDKNGKYVINPQFEMASSFSNGLAIVYLGNRYGYIDREGKTVINPQFDEAAPFIGNIAAVKSNKLIGFIDKNGKYLINPQFDEVLFYYPKDFNELIKSTYYDVNGFASRFIGANNSLGSVLLSDFKEGATLRTVANNKTFCSASVENSSTLLYTDTEQWGFNEDIRLGPILFTFAGTIYETYYDYYNYGSNRSYNWGSPLITILCPFYLNDKARGRGAALASAIANQLNTKQIISNFKSHDNIMYGYNAQKKQGIYIAWRESGLDLFVLTCSEAGFNNLDKHTSHSDNPSSGIGDVEIEAVEEVLETVEGEAEEVVENAEKAHYCPD